MENKEAVQLLLAWSGMCLTCSHWTGERPKGLLGQCKNVESESYNQQTLSCDDCKCWFSFRPSVADDVSVARKKLGAPRSTLLDLLKPTAEWLWSMRGGLGLGAPPSNDAVAVGNLKEVGNDPGTKKSTAK